MRSIGRPVRYVGSRQCFVTNGEIQIFEYTPEELEGGDGLVEGDFVARFVHAQEAEVAVLAHLAILGPVDEEGRVPGCAEFC